MNKITNGRFVKYGAQVAIVIPREMLLDSAFPFSLEEYTPYDSNGEMRDKFENSQLKSVVIELRKDAVVIRQITSNDKPSIAKTEQDKNE